MRPLFCLAINPLLSTIYSQRISLGTSSPHACTEAGGVPPIMWSPWLCAAWRVRTGLSSLNGESNWHRMQEQDQNSCAGSAPGLSCRREESQNGNPR